MAEPAVEVKVVDSLEESTQKYWELSREYHSAQGTVTVGEAINILNVILAFSGPQRPLNRRALEMQSTIIHGGK